MTNRSVFTVAPPEPDRRLPAPPKRKLPSVNKPVGSMTRQELQADMERNPKLVRPLLDLYYAGRLRGVRATDIIEIHESIQRKAKAALAA